MSSVVEGKTEGKTPFERFKQYLVENNITGPDNINNYIKIYFDRGEFESVATDLDHFACFLKKEYERRYGPSKLWFEVFTDDVDYKYFGIIASVYVKLGGFGYWIEVGDFDCKYGAVAEDEKDFNELVQYFIDSLRERYENLMRCLRKAGAEIA